MQRMFRLPSCFFSCLKRILKRYQKHTQLKSRIRKYMVEVNECLCTSSRAGKGCSTSVLYFCAYLLRKIYYGQTKVLTPFYSEPRILTLEKFLIEGKVWLSESRPHRAVFSYSADLRRSTANVSRRGLQDGSAEDPQVRRSNRLNFWNSGIDYYTLRSLVVGGS